MTLKSSNVKNFLSWCISTILVFLLVASASCKGNAWKRHQDTVFWVDIDLGIREGLMFYQTRSNAIILQGTLPAHCILKVERLKTGERSCMKDNTCLLNHHRRSLWGTISIGPEGTTIWVLQLNIDQSGNSFNSHLEKHFILVLPSQPNSLNPVKIERGKPVTQEIVGKLQEELCSSDRSGQPDREGRLHKVQEDNHLKNRDDADKFNLAMDDENIDFKHLRYSRCDGETLSKH